MGGSYADGLDQKVLLRSDGTSVYMTQDFGTAILRSAIFLKLKSRFILSAMNRSTTLRFYS